jgi:hypothetical protein
MYAALKSLQKATMYHRCTTLAVKSPHLKPGIQHYPQNRRAGPLYRLLRGNQVVSGEKYYSVLELAFNVPSIS